MLYYCIDVRLDNYKCFTNAKFTPYIEYNYTYEKSEFKYCESKNIIIGSTSCSYLPLPELVFLQFNFSDLKLQAIIF